MRIVIDAHRGVADLDGVTVPVAPAGGRGEVAIGGPTGPVLRPVTFGERRRLVLDALTAAQPHDALCAGARRVAAVSPGELAVDVLVEEVMALALAGGDNDGPPYAAAVRAIAQATGWGWADLDGAPAREVDCLAVDLGAGAEEDWTRIVVVLPPGDGGDGDPDRLVRLRVALADELMRRAGPLDGVVRPAPDAPADPATGPPATLHGTPAGAGEPGGLPSTAGQGAAPGAPASTPATGDGPSPFASVNSGPSPSPGREAVPVGGSSPMSPLLPPPPRACPGTPAALSLPPSPGSVPVHEPGGMAGTAPPGWHWDRRPQAPGPRAADPSNRAAGRADGPAALVTAVSGAPFPAEPRAHRRTHPARPGRATPESERGFRDPPDAEADAEALAAALAAALHLEADLRGIDRA